MVLPHPTELDAPRHGHSDQWRSPGSIRRRGRQNNTFTIRQNCIAASRNTGGRPGRPALAASHTLSLSSEIYSARRHFRASLQDFQFVGRSRAASGLRRASFLPCRIREVNPADPGFCNTPMVSQVYFFTSFWKDSPAIFAQCSARRGGRQSYGSSLRPVIIAGLAEFAASFGQGDLLVLLRTQSTCL